MGPRLKRPRADHALIAAQLKGQPGVWGTVNTYPSSISADSTAGSIRYARQGFSVYGPAGHFETRTSFVEDGTLLEARYMGAAAAPARRTGGAPALKKRAKTHIRPSGDTDRVLGQIGRGEVWCGPDAARVIAARHEEAYGAVWRTPAPPAPVSVDDAWADALAAITPAAAGGETT